MGSTQPVACFRQKQATGCVEPMASAGTP